MSVQLTLKPTHTMFKRILLSASLIVLGTVAMAQVSIGPKVGVNFASNNTTFKLPSGSIASQVELKPELRIGSVFGVVADIHLSKNWVLTPELIYTQLGVKWNSPESYIAFASRATFNLSHNYIQLPLAIGYNINVTDNFFIRPALGIYYGFGLGGDINSKVGGSGPGGYSSQENSNAISYDAFDAANSKPTGFKRTDIGLNLGATFGIKVGKGNIFLDARISNGTQQIVDPRTFEGPTAPSSTNSYINRNIAISAGYLLNL